MITVQSHSSLQSDGICVVYDECESLGLATVPSVLQLCELSVNSFLMLLDSDDFSGARVTVIMTGDDCSLLDVGHLSRSRHWIVGSWIGSRWIGRIEAWYTTFLHHFTVLLVSGINLGKW